MLEPSLRRIALIALGSAAIFVAGCTRSASTPVTGSGTGTPAVLTGQQATMEAVRAALLTQTAQALAQATSASPTTAPTIALATATSAFGATPLATPVATGGVGCPSAYIVQPGDRLFRIAINLGYDPDFWQTIADANNITSPWIIYPGDELTIPCV